MTLIVGIRCTDGAVIAADSAVTFSSPQVATISDTSCKIRIIKGKLILAGTGQIGMGQRFSWVVENLWNDNKLKGGDPIEMTRAICEGAMKHFMSTSAHQGKYGSLLAFPASKRAEICEFAVQDLQPELKTDQMWYAAMGSGQLLADPYLRLMRHVFWHNGPPSLQSGKFAAMWVVRHAIKAAHGGIAEPIDMAVLEIKGGEPQARMLSKEELQEHSESVESATEHFRAFEQKLLSGDGSSSAPQLPKM